MQFLARRMGFYAAAAFLAISLNFLIPRMMTGDPATIMFARFQGRLDPRALESLKEAFGFVQGPLPEQYVAYLTNLLRGDLGISVLAFPNPVSEVIATGLGWTLRLAGTATIISFVIGTLLGIVAAWRRQGWQIHFSCPSSVFWALSRTSSSQWFRFSFSQLDLGGFHLTTLRILTSRKIGEIHSMF